MNQQNPNIPNSQQLLNINLANEVPNASWRDDLNAQDRARFVTQLGYALKHLLPGTSDADILTAAKNFESLLYNRSTNKNQYILAYARKFQQIRHQLQNQNGDAPILNDNQSQLNPNAKSEKREKKELFMNQQNPSIPNSQQLLNINLANEVPNASWRDDLNAQDRARFVTQLGHALKHLLPGTSDADILTAAKNFESLLYNRSTSKNQYILAYARKFQQIKFQLQNQNGDAPVLNDNQSQFNPNGITGESHFT